MNKTALLLTVVGAVLLTGCARQENEQRVTYCVTKDGEKIEQWEYFRQNHDQQ
ncbi:hemolysin [Vibrio cholerae]|nr:hemolysin [Vibrio cholerae]